jgi:capsular polysaccharide transport system permease protein
MTNVRSEKGTTEALFKSVVTDIRRYYSIVYALMMHDMKSRFFGNGLGQIVMIIWPFAHIGVLLAVYVVTNRPHPYGESLLQYSAVSVYPFICLNYTARFIAYSAQTNKMFLQYPVIKPMDIIMSRAFLEMISITIVAFMVIIVVYVSGANVMPDDPAQAVEALFATMFLSVGFGFLNAPFAFFIPLWTLVVALLIIVLYLTSGIMFLPTTVPEPYRTYLSYNPLLQCVEWFRAAYYSDYPLDLLDKTYLLEISLAFMTTGLMLMKLFRRLF